MKKYATHYSLVSLCLLLLGLLSTLASYAQTKYREGPDFPGVAGATTYTFSQAGTYSFSGSIQTTADPQDAFKVIVASGFKITQAVLQASGGASQQQPTGFVSFADGYPGYAAASFSNDNGVNVTRTGDLVANTADTPYIGLASVDFSLGTTWSIVITVAATGGNACTAPTQPTVSATQAAICAGATTTLSIQSGSLNDATAWKWYSGSCGGTLVGTGSTITVSPTATTTYYVRGEGGCVTPGSCASQQITVSASPNPPAVSSLAYCQFTTVVPPLTATPSSGNTLRWYNSPSGSLLAGAPTPSTATPGTTTYYVSQVNTAGCESTRAALTVTINAAPTPAIVNLAAAYCKDAPAVTLAGTPTGGTFTVNGTTASQLVPASMAPGSYTVAYSYTNSNGCSATTRQNVTINALPMVSIVPSSLSGCAGQTITLSAQGADRYVWNTGQTTTSIPVTATGTMVYSVTGTAISTGCSGSASQAITIYPLPSAPSLLTQQGQAYPGGQSSVNVDLNSGNVNLVASGCNGTLSWSGPNGTSGNSSPIVVSTSDLGTFVYSAACTTNGCTSPATSATVTVSIRLQVQHRDVDNYADNNAVQPVLQLLNQGTGAIPLSALTLRYYLTVENFMPLTNLFIYYAQLGSQNVKLRYVPLDQPRQGALGYVEYSFTPAAGNLAAISNSGPIQSYFAKSDYGGLDERDDYSYAPLRDQLLVNPHITAYYNGVLVWGQEPALVTPRRQLRVLTESKNGPSATAITTNLLLRNEGNLPVDYSQLRIRYYFTADNQQQLAFYSNFMYEGALQGQLVKINPPLANADTYLEIRPTFTGQLMPLSGLGALWYSIYSPQGARFDQTNDYSYQEQPAEYSPNSHVTVYVGNELVWGQEPGASARRASAEPGSDLEVTLLGNPVRGDGLSVQIKGAGGQPLRLQLINAQGRVITQQQIATPQAIEQHTLSLAGQGPGVVFLQVSTPIQSRTLRVLKAE